MIDHLPDGALIRPADKKGIGAIHIPLPVVLVSDHGNERNNATGLQSVLKRLMVDISRAQDRLQVHENSRKTTHSKIAKAAIYVGRTEYWTSDIAADDSFSVQIESNADLGVMDLQHPNCVGVTLTIQFGAECLLVHSVTVRGDT
ncbi:hypothetical protein O9K51_08395 [Purpureocillium lavendulum]|uniref:Uncharacterized protein n=1 Tax=Purpureocillium lavendulum TaxID=1247861 RepID=A0AB34FKK8_9HYPO|nr:hypothetical protein O9K51_08395 [Purpureocillium lavendulum]